MEDLLCTPLYHTPRTNQMGYIKVKAQLPGIYGNVNRPCPWAAPSDSGQFTTINPRRLGFNYCIIFYDNNTTGTPAILLFMLFLLFCDLPLGRLLFCYLCYHTLNAILLFCDLPLGHLLFCYSIFAILLFCDCMPLNACMLLTLQIEIM